jgi:4-diphosphocytidyl-2-C-methyl-D-erythritol kinase
VAIALRKRIPAGGGLGGGSSNAATVLRGLNQLHGDVLPTDHLEQLAGRLGSDIPFFVRGGTARCTGRGEIIQPLAIAPMDFTVLVMAPDLHVPTPTVYRALSPDDLAGPRRSADAMEQALTQGDYNALRKGTFNRLAAPAGRAFAPLQDLAGWLDRELRECNSLELSGSGACFFALYPDDRSAQADAERLAAQPTVEPKLRVFVTRPIWPGDSP